MPDQHPDVLKLQAEAALKRLEEARLHERCPKACKSCSQKHRKCQFKNGHYPKCDLCAKNNRECEIIPTPVSHTRRNDDSNHAIPQQHQYAGSYGYSGTTTFERSRRTSSGPYSSDSSTGSPVDNRSPGGTNSYAYAQTGAYSYGSAASPTQIPSGTYPALQNQPQYPHYSNGHGHPQHHGSSSHTQHERDPTTYCVPSQSHGHSSPSSFGSGPSHWPGPHGAQAQVTPGTAGQGYGYSSSSHPTPPVRQASTTSAPNVHTGTGQSYISYIYGFSRTTQGYPLASPGSPGGSYSAAGSGVYQMSPQNPSCVRYGAGGNGHGYDQSLNNASPGSVNEGNMYYQSGLHQ
ncbi:hypothetical protein ACEPAH_6066 [Sanghuangporus vaninii]